MKFSMLRSSQGFSLTEMVIAISLLAIFLAGSVGIFKPWGVFQAKLATENSMKVFQQNMIGIYKEHAGIAELSTSEMAGSGELVLGIAEDGTQTVLKSTQCDDNVPTDVEIETNFQPLYPFFVDTIAQISRDGFRRPMCLLISDQQSHKVETVADGLLGEPATIYYHKIFLVSKGENGVLDSYWDPATAQFLLNRAETGELVIGGDDQAIVVDGMQIQHENYMKTMDKLRVAAESYRNYFRHQYRHSDQRDPIVNYFHNSLVVDPTSSSISVKSSSVPFQDVKGVLPAVDRTYALADPLGHFAPLRSTRSIPTGASDPAVYSNHDGHVIMQALGLTDGETELPTKKLLSGITHIMVNNAREESGIKSPDATDVSLRSAPYTVELGVELAPDKIGNIHRNVVKIQLGGLWD